MKNLTLGQLACYKREQLQTIIRDAGIKVLKLTRKKSEELMNIILENQDKIESLPEIIIDDQGKLRRRGRKPQYSEENKDTIVQSSSEFIAVVAKNRNIDSDKKSEESLPEEHSEAAELSAAEEDKTSAESFGCESSDNIDVYYDDSEEAPQPKQTEEIKEAEPAVFSRGVRVARNRRGSLNRRYEENGRRQYSGYDESKNSDRKNTEDESYPEYQKNEDFSEEKSESETREYQEYRRESRFAPRNDKRHFRGKDRDYHAVQEICEQDAEYELDYDSDDYSENEPEELSLAELYMPVVCGILDLRPKTHGMLRGRSCKIADGDVRVNLSLIKKHALRVGDMICGKVRSIKHGESGYELEKIISVNGIAPENAARRQSFDQMVPVFPNETYVLEAEDHDMTARVIDLFAPIGKGQRALIVSPPKAGKTICLKKIAAGIAANFPESILIALLVDERPEEVTDMERSIKGSVVASTFDEDPMQHIFINYLVLQRARRLAEMGKDVVILLDSLTRLGRAYNNVAPNTGRTMSGGLDSSALRMPKRFFGSARKFEKGGSLTIIATALIDTGSRMDEVIFEEFKGTGNNEINLSRKLAERRIYPAIDIKKSGTRHDECLQNEETLETMTLLRRNLDNLAGEREPTEVIIENLKKTADNADFLGRLLKRSRVKQSTNEQ